MMDAHTPPRHLTRFYGNTDFALDVIANKQITFIHASTLNDPFDPYLFMETDFAEKRGRLLQYIREHHPADLSWVKRHVTVRSWESTITAIRDRLTALKNSSFIFSTSAESDGVQPRDNLYMWGHYARGHRGVAIEFNTQELTASVAEYSKVASGAHLSPDDLWAEIIYRNVVAPLTAEDIFQFVKQEHDVQTRKIAVEKRDLALHDYLRLLAVVKSVAWEREREWRLVWGNDTTRMKFFRCPIGDGSIETIMLGMQTASGLREDFAAEAERNFPAATLLQAEKRLGGFALDFRPPTRTEP